MNQYKIAEEYCIGCGLCISEKCVQCKKDSKGFIKIERLKNDEQKTFVENVCPVIGCNRSNYQDFKIWGRNAGIFWGYSTDNEIRRMASSGGTLTSICLYLLDKEIVDGIVHVTVDDNNPIQTKVQISQSRKDLLNCCGSRYAISSPWIELKSFIEPDKKYAVVGKPCDVAAINNAQKMGLYKNIIYLFSFFCAGMPSYEANRNLLSTLKTNEAECKSLVYRGNGWPGDTVSIDVNGIENKIDYSTSWGKILGRDVHTYCRICIDGIGEAADISCGDGWYINDGKPDFSEHEGRNVIIPRNEKGKRLLDEICSSGYLECFLCNNEKELEIIQKYQYSRRATMGAKLFAFRLFGRITPLYDKKMVKSYGKYSSLSEKVHIFGGISKRIMKKRI